MASRKRTVAAERPTPKPQTKGYMEDARKAFGKLSPDKKQGIVNAVKLALEANGPTTLGPILISCQRSLATERDGRRYVPEPVTGEAVAGALYALHIAGRVSVDCSGSADVWGWRRAEGGK